MIRLDHTANQTAQVKESYARDRQRTWFEITSCGTFLEKFATWCAAMVRTSASGSYCKTGMQQWALQCGRPSVSEPFNANDPTLTDLQHACEYRDQVRNKDTFSEVLSQLR